MYKKHSKCSLAIFLSFFLLWTATVQAAEEGKTATFTVQEIETNLQDKGMLLMLKGNSTPTYTQYELFSPARLVLDFANAELAEHIDIATVLPKNDFATFNVTFLRDKTPKIMRFEITLAESHTYKVDKIENNLSIRLIPTDKKAAASEQEDRSKKTAATKSDIKPSKDTVATMPSDPTLDALIDSSEAAISSEAQAPAGQQMIEEEMQDSFGFSGYKTKRISVDFYKIDLHNVFRLFRQISNVNLIVDEAVKGSLTLALTDVPWDFALDIVLNLKNLKKEERHNTIVIYPGEKDFSWPERANDNLSFETDVEVIEQEALIIQQSTNQPAELMQAKELLRRAAIEEKNDDIEDAAVMYEKAFKLWPANAKISNKLAALYLVDLRVNAKAVHFAKESLALDKKNYQAALYAAIASANMDNIPNAMEYFAMSINGDPPMKEALISYAAFSEEKGQPEAALKLLNRYAETYSDTVGTMSSRARIYDTMGQTAKATEQYKTLLYSGYQLVPGLKKYIRGRLTMNNDQLTN